MESAEDLLSFRKGKSEPWISQQMWRVRDEGKEIKTKLDSTKSGRSTGRSLSLKLFIMM